MRRLGIIVLTMVVLLAGFWVGLMLNFPGETVSEYLESRVNRSQGFLVELAPARMHWNRVRIATARVRRRDNLEARPLVVLNDFTVPVTWRLVSGLPLSAAVGRQGRVEAFLPWSVGGEAWLEGSLRLEEVPVPEVFEPIAVKGRVNVNGRFQMDEQAQAGARLPEGRLEAQGSNLNVSGVHFGAQRLPAADFSRATLVLRTGREVTVEQGEFQGDIQGTLSGSITPELAHPRRTALALRITASFRPAWLEGLGTLRPVLEGFLKQGRLLVAMEGSVAQPRLRPLQR